MKASLQQVRLSNWMEHQASSSWMIIDWSSEFFRQNRELIPPQTGGCRVYTSQDIQNTEVSRYSVRVQSENPMELTSTGLIPNVWRPLQGVGQCDAILFPTSDTENDALLLIETKYSESDEAWQNYKKSAVKQITDTISQLSNKSCPIFKRNLFGLISCPLLDTIGATAFSPEEFMDIYNQHRLSIHMGNSATFQDAQNISFI
jgi:hypothetical protein